MKSLDRFLEHRVNRLIGCDLAGKQEMPPVDLREIAKLSGVFSIEERRMIPEAVLSPEAAGFRIYLQSNFQGLPGASVRQRFSLAHEIAHTFFYELRDGVRRPIRGAPRGNALETACHQGAGLLLVPRRSLSHEIHRIGEPIGAKHAIELSRKFNVSAEVMVRRLNDCGVFELTDLTLVLVRRPPGNAAVIEFAAYPPWLKSILPDPQRGMAFSSWIQNGDRDFRLCGVSDSDGSRRDVRPLFEEGLQRRTHLGTLRVTPFCVSSSQHIFELRI